MSATKAEDVFDRIEEIGSPNGDTYVVRAVARGWPLRPNLGDPVDLDSLVIWFLYIVVTGLFGRGYKVGVFRMVKTRFRRSLKFVQKEYARDEATALDRFNGLCADVRSGRFDGDAQDPS